MKNLYIFTLNWLMAMKALRPKSWKSAAVDDTFVAVAAQLFLEKGAPLDQEDCDEIEKQILGEVYDLDQKAGDVEPQSNYFVPSDEVVDVTDTKSVWFAHIRRPATLEHVVSSLHADACQIKSNTLMFPNKKRIISLAEYRLQFPVKALKGATRSSWMHTKALNELLDIDQGIAIKYVYGNFDTRPRTYAKKGNVGLTGGEAYRASFDSEVYAFDSEVQYLFEEKILKRQFQLSPDKALQYASLSDKDCMARHGVPLWKAVTAYKEGVDTQLCHYWAEIDLMGSGPVNGSCQINDQGLFSQISDISHDKWIHVRKLFANHLSERYPSLASLPWEEFDKLLKLVLSPLQYGAGGPGVYNGLTGNKYEEAIEVDWELYSEVNTTLRAMFPTEDVDEFEKEVMAFAKVLHKEYCICFWRLKKAMDAVTKAYAGFLEAGQIPTYTSYSGQVNYGPVAKRSKTKTHWAETSVVNAFGKTVPFKAKVSDKKFLVKDLKSCAFSWFLHGIDAEIISLFTIKAHDAGIQHFTNHDAVFIRLCDWHEAQRIMAWCVIEVGAYKVFQQSGWDSVEMVSDTDCHWETNTPEVLV